MPLIEPQPLYLKDAVLTLGEGGDDFQKTVSSVAFVPTSTTATWQGMSPDATYSETTAATWTCNLTYAQDWDSADSLSRWLYEHAGETVPVIFKPKKAGSGIWYADIVPVEGQIGGAVNAFAEGTVTCGVVGRPTPTAPTPTP